MKPARCLAILAALALLAPLRAGPELWQVRVEMQIVSVPTSVALPLVPVLRDPRQIAAAVGDLQAKISRGEATLVAWPVVWTKSGQRGETETIEEIRYPTEFDPVQFAQYGRPMPRPAPRVILPDGMPTVYETRNLGVTLEVTPTVIGDGTRIDLQIAPQHVRFFGFKRFNVGKPNWNSVGIIDQPEFFVTKTTNSMAVRNGEWKLAGVFVVSKPEPHVELFLLRATAQSLTR